MGAMHYLLSLILLEHEVIVHVLDVGGVGVIGVCEGI
jgi:hypothetical protein